jgi:ubiquinone/menaquinone biosynthesis C-methylase UbiE
MEPKSFYQTYLANDNIYEIDEILTDLVLEASPDEVLDFGTGTGKNLRLINHKRKGITLCGIDISLLNIIYAHSRNDIPFVIKGDEYFLCRLTSFSVVMTCSVLCHIKDIDSIIKEFKRIATKSIIIAETNDIAGEFYYPHDYESYGFVDLKKDWYSAGNETTYKFYKYDRV